MRWLGRSCSKRRGLTLAQAQLALAALTALPSERAPALAPPAAVRKGLSTRGGSPPRVPPESASRRPPPVRGKLRRPCSLRSWLLRPRHNRRRGLCEFLVRTQSAPPATKNPTPAPLAPRVAEGSQGRKPAPLTLFSCAFPRCPRRHMSRVMTATAADAETVERAA